MWGGFKSIVLAAEGAVAGMSLNAEILEQDQMGGLTSDFYFRGVNESQLLSLSTCAFHLLCVRVDISPRRLLGLNI